MAMGADGYPVISYQDSTNNDLKVLKCGNAECSSGNSTVSLDTSIISGFETAITVGADGYPVVVYGDGTNLALKVAKCSNTSCTSAVTLTTVDTNSTNFFYNLSITLGADDFPIISYHDAQDGDLMFIKCGNASCSSGNTLRNLDNTAVAVGANTSIALGTNNYPFISYMDNKTLMFF